jgi:hypothetical protein
MVRCAKLWYVVVSYGMLWCYGMLWYVMVRYVKPCQPINIYRRFEDKTKLPNVCSIN